ncbi:hypothetical protein SISNIDRAFT_220070, partial [Sistotremastrum niveocremeum HHB9708]
VQSLLPIEWLSEASGLSLRSRKRYFGIREAGQTWSFRGSKSRNKVSVGEPAEGSLTNFSKLLTALCGHSHMLKVALEHFTHPLCTLRG